ncbi:MAG: biotin/lipoyl-binding protein [Dysgonamonadaceae bacterium]
MESENKSGSKLIPISVFALVIIAVGLYGFFFLHHEDKIIQGEAEITEVRISSKVPGRIARFLVEEGDKVKKGDTLAILSIPDIDAKLAQADAAQQGAEAQNEKAVNGTRHEQVQGAYEMWQKSKAGLDIAKKSYDRVQSLFDKGVTTAQKRDEAEANYKASIATEKAAKSQYDMAVAGAQREDKEAAKAMVNRAKGAVAEVKSYINESYLISPIDGEISEKFPNVGELVGSGAPIMNVMDLTDKWGSFNVREDLLPNFKMNQVITVFVPALNKNVDLKIYYLKDLGSYAAWKATKTTGQYDRKTFEVRARFVKEDIDVRPGMSLIIGK